MLLSCRGITVGGVFRSENSSSVIAGLDPAIHAKAFRQSRDCRKSSEIQEAFKVKPFRVRFFDQFDLPFAWPGLDCLFPGDCLWRNRMLFVPDKPNCTVASGKLRALSCFMLINASRQVIGYTRIECSIFATGEHVNPKSLHDWIGDGMDCRVKPWHDGWGEVPNVPIQALLSDQLRRIRICRVSCRC